MSLISELCKAEKENKRITYQDIAEKSNVPVSTVTNFLSQGSKAPSIYTVGPICAALGVSLDKYFGINVEQEQTEDESKKLYIKINYQDKEIESLKGRIVSYKRVLKIFTGIIFALIAICVLIAFCPPVMIS